MLSLFYNFVASKFCALGHSKRAINCIILVKFKRNENLRVIHNWQKAKVIFGLKKKRLKIPLEINNDQFREINRSWIYFFIE